MTDVRRKLPASGLLVLVALAGSLAIPSPAFAHTINCSRFNIDDTASRPLHRVMVPPLRACKTVLSHGYPIPDPHCTPGAINPTVTTSVLEDPGFRTRCVRNDDTTEHQKTATYRWYGINHPSHNTGHSQTCELDHLVSLELGGADTLDNIWPECGPAGVPMAQRYFKEKDAVENYLATQVKAGRMKLEDAQRGIAEDWTRYLAIARKSCRRTNCR